MWRLLRTRWFVFSILRTRTGGIWTARTKDRYIFRGQGESEQQGQRTGIYLENRGNLNSKDKGQVYNQRTGGIWTARTKDRYIFSGQGESEQQGQRTGIYIFRGQVYDRKVHGILRCMNSMLHKEKKAPQMPRLLCLCRHVNVFIFLKNYHLVMKTTTKNRKRNDRFL